MKIDININHHCNHGCVSCVVRESNSFLNELLRKQKPYFSEKKAKECVNIIEKNPMESNEKKWQKIKDIVDDVAHEKEVGRITQEIVDRGIIFHNGNRFPTYSEFIKEVLEPNFDGKYYNLSQEEIDEYYTWLTPSKRTTNKPLTFKEKAIVLRDVEGV